jgi:hypothetical protein
MEFAKLEAEKGLLYIIGGPNETEAEMLQRPDCRY